MTNKVAIALIAAAAILTSCAGPSSTQHAATGPATGAGTTPTTVAPADPGRRWLGRDADVSIRHVVTGVDEAGQPLLGATVTAGDQEVRTGPDGRALLFGNVGGATVRWGDSQATADFGQDSREHRVSLPVHRPEGRA